MRIYNFLWIVSWLLGNGVMAKSETIGFRSLYHYSVQNKGRLDVQENDTVGCVRKNKLLTLDHRNRNLTISSKFGGTGVLLEAVPGPEALKATQFPVLQAPILEECSKTLSVKESSELPKPALGNVRADSYWFYFDCLEADCDSIKQTLSQELQQTIKSIEKDRAERNYPMASQFEFLKQIRATHEVYREKLDMFFGQVGNLDDIITVQRYMWGADENSWVLLEAVDPEEEFESFVEEEDLIDAETQLLIKVNSTDTLVNWITNKILDPYIQQLLQKDKLFARLQKSNLKDVDINRLVFSLRLVDALQMLNYFYDPSTKPVINGTGKRPSKLTSVLATHYIFRLDQERWKAWSSFAHSYCQVLYSMLGKDVPTQILSEEAGYSLQQAKDEWSTKFATSRTAMVDNLHKIDPSTSLITWLNQSKLADMESESGARFEKDPLFEAIHAKNSKSGGQDKDVMLVIRLVRFLEALQSFIYLTGHKVRHAVSDYKRKPATPLELLFLNEILFPAYLSSNNIIQFEDYERVARQFLQAVMMHDCGSHIFRGSKFLVGWCKKFGNVDLFGIVRPFSPLTQVQCAVDDFEFKNLLGEGGFGKVYLAEKVTYPLTDVLYAIKVVDRERINYQDILRESKYSAQINNPAYRDQVYGKPHAFSMYLGEQLCVFQEPESVYFVMNYIPNGDLHHFYNKIHRAGKLTRAQLEEYVKFHTAQLLLAIEALHKIGLVHRDVKPDNILVDKDMSIRLVDYGLSKMAKEGIDQHFRGYNYYPPEMMKNEGRYGKEIDFYSFGATIFECLTNKMPYTKLRAKVESSFPEDTPEQYVEAGKTFAMSMREEEMCKSNKLVKEATKDSKSKHSNILGKFSDEVIDLVCQLVKLEPSDRLKEVESIKNHPWFKDIDWEKLEENGVEVPQGLENVVNDSELSEKPEPTQEPELSSSIEISDSAEITSSSLLDPYDY